MIDADHLMANLKEVQWMRSDQMTEHELSVMLTLMVEDRVRWEDKDTCRTYYPK